MTVADPRRAKVGARRALPRYTRGNRRTGGGVGFIDNLYVIAPGGQEAPVVIAQLASAGLRCTCIEPPALIAAIRANALGTAILTTEALEITDREELRAALAEQPQWSDVPLILLSSSGYVPLTSRRSIEGFGNVTVLERPLHPSTLVTAVATALRTRARQRKTQAFIAQREEAQAKVRSLAATLEARVMARTIELSDALVERQAAEERLRQSEERYRLTIELSSQTPWIATSDFRIISFGRTLPDPSTVASARDLADGKWRSLIHPADRRAAEQAWRDASHARLPLDCTFRMRAPGRPYAWHRVRANPKLDGAGNIERWYGTIENIHEVRRGEERVLQLQSELIHVSRVSAMGTMASTLAHELNQPLTAAANYVRGSRRLLATVAAPGLEPIDAALAEADLSVMRAGDIVRRLRKMVMLRQVDRIPETATSVIREACALALIDVASLGIVIHLDLDKEDVWILVDRVQVQQVLINLLRNAVEAVQLVARREIWIALAVAPPICEITIRDSGKGISPVMTDKLFTTFNSTKADGMGIGLSISRTIVEAHGGQISGQNDPRGGAIFSIRLPLAEEPVSAAARTPRSASGDFALRASPPA